jgi:hypothetical protein
MTEATKTVHICIAQDGNETLIIDRAGSTRDTHCAIQDVPVGVSITAVMLHLARLVIWPWPKTLIWADVSELPPGSLVKTGEYPP